MVAFNFQELFLKFFSKGKEFELRGITRKPTTHFYKEGSVSTPRFPQPTRLTPQQLEEKRAKGFATIVIENTLKVIIVLRRNYFT